MATSSPEHVENDNSSIVDASTPASLFSSGTIDLPSLELLQDLFTLLTAVPVFAHSAESDSGLVSVPPDVKPFSDPAGQDRVREFTLELSALNLY